MTTERDDNADANTRRQVPRLDDKSLRAILDGIPDGVFIQIDGCFAYLNPAAAGLFGTPDADDLRGRPVADRFAPDLRAIVAERIRRLNERREAVPLLEEQVLRPDGTLVDVEVSAVPFELGGRQGALVFVRNISRRRQAEAALRASEQRLRFALAKSRTGGWDLDLMDHSAFRTVEHDRIFGYDELLPEWTYETFLAHVLPEDRADVDARFRAATAHRTDWHFECRIRRVDGQVRWIRAAGGHQLDPDGRARRVAGIIQDITEIKESELERVRLAAQLQQSQKMEVVGQLAGGIAHDFNNLLMVQRGYCEMLREGLPADDPLADGLARIDACAERAATLTRQLLAFSRKQVLQPQTVDLRDLVGGLEDMLRRLLGEHIELVIAVSPPAATVNVDPGQIEQVVINLAVNARDAMPRGGRLTIAIEAVDLDDARAADFEDAAPGPYVRLGLTDTGCGMDEDTRRRIFEPFFTTKGTGRGTGLGLSTVHGIVHQSGGTIRVDSAPGRGAAFQVYLPRVDDAPAPLRRAATAVVRGCGECVLVVEDDEGLRDLADIMLTNLGYRPVLAADGSAALDLIEMEGLRPDLLLTDVVMPRMGGRTLVDHARQIVPELKVLYMSGYTRDMITHHGVRDEGPHFLQKPFSLVDLSHRIHDALGH